MVLNQISQNTPCEIVMPSAVKGIRGFFGQLSGQHSLQPNTKGMRFIRMLSVSYLSSDQHNLRLNGAVEKTRTSTPVKEQRPQRCASTNSATTARSNDSALTKSITDVKG